MRTRREGVNNLKFFVDIINALFRPCMSSLLRRHCCRRISVLHGFLFLICGGQSARRLRACHMAHSASFCPPSWQAGGQAGRRAGGQAGGRNPTFSPPLLRSFARSALHRSLREIFIMGQDGGGRPTARVAVAPAPLTHRRRRCAQKRGREVA